MCLSLPTSRGMRQLEMRLRKRYGAMHLFLNMVSSRALFYMTPLPTRALSHPEAINHIFCLVLSDENAGCLCPFVGTHLTLCFHCLSPQSRMAASLCPFFLCSVPILLDIQPRVNQYGNGPSRASTNHEATTHLLSSSSATGVRKPMDALERDILYLYI